ncbi:MAG TPA: hypothetical protein VF174_15865 [Micromonosporaceae bacterium]
MGVVITAREIYEAVVRLTGRVDVLIEQQKASEDVDRDHEQRLRALERARWPLPSLSLLIALAGIVIALFR